MKHNTVLIVVSLLNILFVGLHLTGDIVFGIENLFSFMGPEMETAKAACGLRKAASNESQPPG